MAVQAVTITPASPQSWAPANVLSSGTVAITTAYPNATNGSTQFVQAGSADKADFEIVNANPGGFGLVKDITSVGYEFHRASGTVAAFLAPVLRLSVYDPVSGKSSLLIWEPVYNGLVVERRMLVTRAVAAEAAARAAFQNASLSVCRLGLAIPGVSIIPR